MSKQTKEFFERLRNDPQTIGAVEAAAEGLKEAVRAYAPALSLSVIKPKEAKDTAELGSPAAAADPPFEPGDRIEGLGGKKVSDYWELAPLLVEDRAKPVVFRVVRDDGSEKAVDVRVEPQRPDLVAKAIAPDYALGAHTASLGLAFNTGHLFPPEMATAPRLKP